jgi:DNA-binding Lrp family transcriptional regulator
MTSNEKNEIRRLKNGDWYWINRRILNIHGQKLKASGLAVYNALASYANFKNQACFPTQKAIAELIGMSKRTVIRRIRELQELGLIGVEKKGNRSVYHLLRPKVPKETQVGDKRDTREVTPGNTNKNYITRINNNNIDNLNFHFLKSKTFKGFKPETREELLALDLAKGLNDLKALTLYLAYARKYPESLLRKVLGDVKEIPIKKIKKGRAALFNYLIKKYAQEASKNHRH